MNRIASTFVLAGFVTALVGGCGGGASTEPTVTIKSATESKVDPDGGIKDPPPGGTAAGRYGTLKGKVIIEGWNSKLTPLAIKGKANKDPTVCAADGNIPDQRMVVGPNGELANVFIYLRKMPKGGIPSGDLPVKKFDQKGCIFLPHAMVYQAGQVVRVLSGDAVPHNTKTDPKRNSGENFQVPANDRDGANKINLASGEQAPFLVQCSFHSWMKAWHLVLDHPYGAVTKKDGSFEIPNLPAGKHKFRIWHENANDKNRLLDGGFEITIEAGDEPTEISPIKYSSALFKP